jgi:hypothetical protein
LGGLPVNIKVQILVSSILDTGGLMTKLPKGEFIIYLYGSIVFRFLCFLEETKPPAGICRKDYYQEGNHVYNELNVLEAFRKALTTWARWVDANVDPMKSLVFFRGYSASHFR